MDFLSHDFYCYIWLPLIFFIITCSFLIYYVLYKKRKDEILGNGFFGLCRIALISEIIRSILIQVLYSIPSYGIFVDSIYLPYETPLVGILCFLGDINSHSTNFLWTLIVVNRLYIFMGWPKISESAFNKLLKYAFYVYTCLCIVTWSVIDFTSNSLFLDCRSMNLTPAGDPFTTIICNGNSTWRQELSEDINKAIRLLNCILALISWLIILVLSVKMRKLQGNMQRSMRYNEVKLGIVMGIDILIQILGVSLLFIFVNGSTLDKFKWPGMQERFVTQMQNFKILVLPLLLYIGSSSLRMAFHEIIWSKILPKRTRTIQVQPINRD